MISALLISTLVFAITPTPAPTAAPNNTGAPPEVHGYMKPGPPSTIAAEVKKDCAMKPLAGGTSTQVEACTEGNKKHCPKGYALKQQPAKCPEGKMCAQVMQDFCEKGTTK